MEITDELLKNLKFLPFRKETPLKARPLTEDDFRERKGVIQTLEGVVSFQPGDYLAVGVKNEEWPILRETFEGNYYKVESSSEDEFAYYKLIDNVRLACQIFDTFSVRRSNGDMYHGKPGDYLVRTNSGSLHILDKEVFEQSYIPLD
jgi:hypothetical protein